MMNDRGESRLFQPFREERVGEKGAGEGGRERDKVRQRETEKREGW